MTSAVAMVIRRVSARHACQELERRTRARVSPCSHRPHRTYSFPFCCRMLPCAIARRLSPRGPALSILFPPTCGPDRVISIRALPSDTTRRLSEVQNFKSVISRERCQSLGRDWTLIRTRPCIDDGCTSVAEHLISERCGLFARNFGARCGLGSNLYCRA